jgi:WD40 repeat protein/predicted Ser/Thr protein kinase
VLRRIGAGGMGVVYAAYDEELDRRVAIKLVRPGRDDAEARARTRREAQALARLSHPNVVQVYEVGEWAGQVYVAMEFVPGRSLRAWQELRPRGWRELVAMYLQAGRGLAAAHARGLVHRDFKPDNVLVGDDDRPRVVDFGLAHVRGDLSPGTGASAAAELSSGTGAPERLTVSGAVLGTPAYMAPEQLAGGEADARGDVFSFCVALYEALHRVRPFAGERSDDLLAAVRRGELVRPGRPVDVPARLLRVLLRGLAADPAARWPAMDPLLAALARDPTRARRRLGLAALGLALAAGSALGLLELRERRQAAALAAEQRRAEDAEAGLRRARLAAADEDRRAEARRLAAAAELVAADDPALRLLLAAEAAQLRAADEPPVAEAAQALLAALDAVRSEPFVPPGAAVLDAVAESPDGRRLAVGARDGAVTLWATADPRRPHALRPADGRGVRDLAFAPDGARLAAAVGDDVLVWTLPVPGDSVPEDMSFGPPVRWDSPLVAPTDLAWRRDGAALLARGGDLAAVLGPAGPRPLRGHTAAVRRAAWSPDGAAVVTAAADGAARVWPAHGPPRVLRLPGPARPLAAAAFSPDGREVVVASDDHTAAVFPVRGGPPLRLRGHTGPVYAAAFTADGEQVLTLSTDATARLWDRGGGSTRVDLPGHRDVLGGARIDAQAELVLGTPAGGAAWLWQLAAPGPPLVLHGHRGSVVAARFSADGRRVLTASSDGTARRWHVQGDPGVLRGHAAGIEHASFTPDGRAVVTASMDGTARLWPADARPPVVLRGHREGSSVAAALGPDGRVLATAGGDGLARVWSLADAPPTLRATLPAGAERGPPLHALAWSPAGDRLALAGDDGRIVVTTFPAAGEPAAEETLDAEPVPSDTPRAQPVPSDISRARPAPSDTRLAEPAPSDTPRARPAPSDTPRAPVRALAFAEELLASAGDDAVVRLWRLAPSPVLRDSFVGHDRPVRALAFAPGRLISAGDDATARVWPLAGGPPVVLRGHLRAIWQIRVAPDGAHVLTASADGTARLWPLAGGPPEVLRGHADAVWAAEFSADGAQILTASADGTARLWRRDGDRFVATVLPLRGASGPAGSDDALWTAALSPDGRHALVAGADAVARVLPIRLADQLAEACARTGRNLSAQEWLRLVGDRPRRPTCPDLPP